MAKPKITRTYGPIHFEDLDPHRFEDLVRELIYDYKEWQTIEATGRSGGDDGFDVRAYEKVGRTSQSESDDKDEIEEVGPMDGNLWMIQCKREKEIGPARVKEIISEIDPKTPPYGYILAASANFSKKSYDTFREELRKKGVMEFYLWGKGDLEDMLYLPKNDRILFAFFGVSFVSRRKSRTTEIRQTVNNKNKLYRIFTDDIGHHKFILVRDAKDTKYPYEEGYKDFETNPRWREYQVVEHNPRGLVVEIRNHFAYVDTEKKEYDFTEAVNLIYRDSDSQKDKDKQQKAKDAAEDLWDHLPKRNQAMYVVRGLIRYDEMLVIDDKGDSWYKFPHVFVDFEGLSGPFSGYFITLKIEGRTQLLNDYKRGKTFPVLSPKPKQGKIHETKGITLDEQSFRNLKHDRLSVLYDCDGRYSFLKPRDAVPIENNDGGDSSKYYLKITFTEKVKVKDYLEHNGNLEWEIEQQIGRKPSPDEFLNIYEFKKTYDFVIDRTKKLGF